VYSNGGLGIDLGDDGVTPDDKRDADAGPNDLQNFPFLTAVTPKGKFVKIHGLLFSTPRTTFRLEFFSNDACDPSGYGEGQTFLGFAYVKTNKAGIASFNITLPISLPPGAFVTSTATDPGGSTSEFSNCVRLPRRHGGGLQLRLADDPGRHGTEMSGLRLPVNDHRRRR
jgi:hypothetical protein